MNGWRVVHIDEPKLAFGFGQKEEHPKDGLFLYGPPLSNQNPARMDIGVIGTAVGVARYKRWTKSLGSTIGVPEKGKKENKTMWPGFQAVFGVPWPIEPFTTIVIDGDELSKRIRIENRHEAIFNAVALYADALRQYLKTEEAHPQLWYAVVPEEIFRYGRPKSVIPRDLREKSKVKVGRKAARSILRDGSLFAEEVEAAAIYEYELNFHN